MSRYPSIAPAQVAAAVERIRADLSLVTTAIGDGVLCDVAEQGLPELAVDLLAAADAATAAGTAVVGRVHATGVLRARGVVSTKSWVKAVTGGGDRDAAALLARARDLQRPELARTRAAWLAGVVTAAQVREVSLGLVGCAKRAGADPDLLALVYGSGQDALLLVASADLDVDLGPGDGDSDQAPDSTAGPDGTAAASAGGRVSADRVRAAAGRLLAIVHPDGASAAALAAEAEQHLALLAVGAQVMVRGMLTTEGHAMVATALDRIVDRWYRDGTLTPDRKGTDPGGAARARLRADHVRALALVELARRFCEQGQGGVCHQVRPHLTLTVDLDHLVAGRGSGTVQIPGTDPAPIPVGVLEHLVCAADLTVAITGRLGLGCDVTGGVVVSEPESGVETTTAQVTSTGAAELMAAWLVDQAREVLWLGRERRHVDARLWRLLILRDQHCVFPGCRADVSRCQPHHVLEWWRGGRTDPGNLVLLCAAHHRLVHQDQWVITARPGAGPLAPGYWQIHPPHKRAGPCTRAA